MQTGTIIRRNAEQFIPNEYMGLVLAANPHGWGAAIVTEEEGKKQLLLNSLDEPLTVEFLQDTLKTFAKQDIVLYVCNSEAGLSKSDISPHVLVVRKEGEEEIPQIVGFIDGNFPNYVKKDSSHPPEYFVALDYLTPKLEGLYDLCGGDLDKVVEQLKKPHFKKELLLNSVSRGTITLVCANGSCLTYDQGDTSAEFPWGWVSNTHGYKAGVKTAPDEPKKKSMFPSLNRSTVREKPPSAAIAEAVVPPKVEATVIKNYTTKKEKPPAASSRSQRKDWYKTRLGYLPKGWKDGIEVEVYVDPTGKLLTFAQSKALGLLAAGLPKTNNPPAERDDTHSGNGKSDAPLEVSGEILPIMSPAAREHIKTLMKDAKVQKIIAENADMILDPTKVQKLEEKFADFSRQVGAKSIDEFLMWDYPMFYELGKTKPDALAVMAWSFRNIIAYHRTKKEVKVETVAAPPEKKSMFPQRVAAA